MMPFPWMRARPKADAEGRADESAGTRAFDFCVVGAGRMGASIAGTLALQVLYGLARRALCCAGCRSTLTAAAWTQGASVALFDRSDYDRRKGYDIMRADMKILEQRGLMLPADKDSALRRITLVDSHEQCVQAAIVVEAIFENLDAKRQLFGELAAAAHRTGATPVLSTNSMNFSIGQITQSLSPATTLLACGVRFLYPVFFMRPVEVSGHEDGATQEQISASATLSRVMGQLRRFGFEPFYHHLGSTQNTGLFRNNSGFYRRKLNQHEVHRYEQQLRRFVRGRCWRATCALMCLYLRLSLGCMH